MASIASPDPCPERALVGKLMRRQRMKFRSQYGRIICSPETRSGFRHCPARPREQIQHLLNELRSEREVRCKFASLRKQRSKRVGREIRKLVDKDEERTRSSSASSLGVMATNSRCDTSRDPSKFDACSPILAFGQICDEDFPAVHGVSQVELGPGVEMLTSGSLKF